MGFLDNILGAIDKLFTTQKAVPVDSPTLTATTPPIATPPTDATAPLAPLQLITPISISQPDTPTTITTPVPTTDTLTPLQTLSLINPSQPDPIPAQTSSPVLQTSTPATYNPNPAPQLVPDEIGNFGGNSLGGYQDFEIYDVIRNSTGAHVGFNGVEWGTGGREASMQFDTSYDGQFTGYLFANLDDLKAYIDWLQQNPARHNGAA
jgi:hypothetical protein